MNHIEREIRGIVSEFGRAEFTVYDISKHLKCQESASTDLKIRYYLKKMGCEKHRFKGTNFYINNELMEG